LDQRRRREQGRREQSADRTAMRQFIGLFHEEIFIGRQFQNNYFAYRIQNQVIQE